MSILIKGMDMPIKGSCTVTIHSDGRVTVTPTRPLRHGFIVGKAIEAPSAERIGKWIIEHEPFTWMGYAKWHCSCCGFKCGYGQEIKNRTNYCPNCGARMEGEKE